jgi:hypothetical protein
MWGPGDVMLLAVQFFCVFSRNWDIWWLSRRLVASQEYRCFILSVKVFMEIKSYFKFAASETYSLVKLRQVTNDGDECQGRRLIWNIGIHLADCMLTLLIKPHHNFLQQLKTSFSSNAQPCLYDVTAEYVGNFWTSNWVETVLLVTPDSNCST